MFKILFALPLLLITLPALAQTKPIRNWPRQDKPKLSWKDFKVVNACETAVPDGTLEWGIVKTYISNTQNPQQNDYMESMTILKLDDTWVCDNVVKDDTLLMYLQITYDLAELATRQLNDTFRKRSLKGMDEEQIRDLLVVNQLRVEQNLIQRRSEFFWEARHGLNKSAIVKWRAIIDKELKATKG